MSSNTHIETLNNLLSNLRDGVSYKQQLDFLIKYFEDLERNTKINGSNLIILCLLYYNAGQYNSVLPYKNKYKVTFFNL
jgi:hypothetical protein